MTDYDENGMEVQVRDLTPEELEEVDPRNAEDIQEVIPPEYRDAKERFTEMYKNYRNSALVSVSERITDQQQVHDNYLRSARNALWELNEAKEQREALENMQDTKTEFVQAQFDALLRHRKVNALGIRENQLLIKTEELDMENPSTGDTLPLGQFEITFPMRARDSQYLNVINKTNAREDSEEGSIWQHPHVNQEGDPCWGSLETDMFDLLSKGEISAAFEFLLQYLQTINPDDEYGKHWELWED